MQFNIILYTYKKTITMKDETLKKLNDAYQFCIYNDKSTEFTIQYLMDYASVNLDCVLKFIKSQNK